MNEDTNKNRTLIFEILVQLSRSRTVAVNVLFVGLVTAFLKFKGVTLTDQEITVAIEATAVIWTVINIILRAITKKPLMQKTKLME